MLERFKAASNDPTVAVRQTARAAVNEARLVRAAERQSAKKAHDADLAEQAARDAEFAAEARREAERASALADAEPAERAVALAATGKADRDARYAARKAAKKLRRRGH
jgi:translation initiation factor 2 beta subunit (eIF-2beta)/eIF-5